MKVNCVVLPDGDRWVIYWTWTYSWRDDLDFLKFVFAGLLGSAFVVVKGGESILDEPYGGGIGD